MAQEDKIYVIIDVTNVSGVTFSEVMETSSNTLRFNNDSTLTFVKYTGSEPTSLQAIPKVNTDGRDYHTHTQILEILSTTGTTGWVGSEII